MIGYPVTYGDSTDNELKLSDRVIEVTKSERFQSHMTAVFFAFLTLVSYAQPSPAIPPEYGEAAANIAEGVEQVVPQLGEVVGNAHIPPQQVVGNNAAQIGQAGRVGLNQVANGQNINQLGGNGIPLQPGQAIKPPAWRLPGPPTSVGGQYINTLLIIGSGSWICLDASWGNPVLAYGCVGVVGGLLNEIRKKCF